MSRKSVRSISSLALEHLLASFPFVIKGFHADNGLEYINRRVARLLEKLRIEFTKSRARHSNDNALVECKNGHVVRTAARPCPYPATLGRPAQTFIASTSIPTSTIIGPVCSHKPSLTRPGNNASVILTNP